MSRHDEMDPIVFSRSAAQIVITRFDGGLIHTIDLPEIQLRRSEVSPEWLALHDAERLSPQE